MIQSFGSTDTERLFHGRAARRLPSTIWATSQRKLALIDNANSLEDLRIPRGNRLEALTGNRPGQHSIRVDDQWRVCFRWQTGDAFDVEIVDYP